MPIIAWSAPAHLFSAQQTAWSFWNKNLIVESWLKSSWSLPCFGIKSEFVYVVYKVLHDLAPDCLSCLISHTVCLIHVKFTSIHCTSHPPLPLAFTCALACAWMHSDIALQEASSGPHSAGPWVAKCAPLATCAMHECIETASSHQTCYDGKDFEPVLGIKWRLSLPSAVILAIYISALMVSDCPSLHCFIMKGKEKGSCSRRD